MTLRSSIRRMYQEIVSYGGNFGDPIAEFVDFDPLPIVRDSGEDQWVRCGAAVALLVNFCSSLDNTAFDVAKGSREYRQLRLALEQGLLADFLPIQVAVTSISGGELAFYSSLADVYAQCKAQHEVDLAVASHTTIYPVEAGHSSKPGM